MKLQLSRSYVMMHILAGVIIAALVFGVGLLLINVLDMNQLFSGATTKGNVITEENALPGTRSWEIPDGKGAITEIQAYASATSVQPGESLTFYVSTKEEGTTYSIDIYRIGWYKGYGGRHVLSHSNQLGHAQGYYDTVANRLMGCSSCYVNTNTGLVEAKWKPSYTFTVPYNWTTGIYLAKLTDANNMQTYIPFDIRGNFYSSYVIVTPDTTYAAYNIWGGYSLYRAYNRPGKGSLQEAVKVSFDRPYVDEYGSSQVLAFEADAIRWLERQGYNLSYISSVDLHEDPAQLLHHQAYLSLGHDEYWTKEMRDGVENARNTGVGLAFLGANTAYWQIRFEADSIGIPNRTIVCYKVETMNHDLAKDPFYGRDNTRVTTIWRDLLLARPENALIGIMYSGYSHKPPGFPWRVSFPANSPLLDGTGLQPGQQYGCDNVGYEWDRIFNNGATPVGLQVIGTSKTINIDKHLDISNTTYYIAPSGALVFATGSIFWTFSLDSYRFNVSEVCDNHDLVVPGMQKLMTNVMDALVIHHISG